MQRWSQNRTEQSRSLTGWLPLKKWPSWQHPCPGYKRRLYFQTGFYRDCRSSLHFKHSPWKWQLLLCILLCDPPKWYVIFSGTARPGTTWSCLKMRWQTYLPLCGVLSPDWINWERVFPFGAEQRDWETRVTAKTVLAGPLWAHTFYNESIHFTLQHYSRAG